MIVFIRRLSSVVRRSSRESDDGLARMSAGYPSLDLSGGNSSSPPQLGERVEELFQTATPLRSDR